MNFKIARDGWELISAEDRNAAHPETFQIPAREKRESLAPGEGAKLLFNIETREGGHVVDRGVDRMWVIVKARTDAGYIGVLDNDPGTAENLRLREGDCITFGPEHMADIATPPREYVPLGEGPEVCGDGIPAHRLFRWSGEGSREAGQTGAVFGFPARR